MKNGHEVAATSMFDVRVLTIFVSPRHDDADAEGETQAQRELGPDGQGRL